MQPPKKGRQAKNQKARTRVDRERRSVKQEFKQYCGKEVGEVLRSVAPKPILED